jgi:death-on-curing protein
MIKITKEQVMIMHSISIKETGGIDGLRDNSLLESALSSIFQTFGGEDLYPSIEDKAAMLSFSLINNHAFIDGNKRTGILALVAFLELNGIILKTTNSELIELGLGIASGNINQYKIKEWIIFHS